MNQLVHSRRSINSQYRYHQKCRIQTSQQLNHLKTSIKNTFDSDNKIFHQVKELTSKANPAFSQRLNQICLKYSICPTSRKKRTSSEDINVDFIAKKYVKRRSIENRKVTGKNELQKTIGVISRRYQAPKQSQFFKLQCQKLKQMNKKIASQKSHPYLTLYQKSQGQVMKNFKELNQINFNNIQPFPNCDETDQWIKKQKAMKNVYDTVKKLRAKSSRYRQRPKQEEVNQFLIM